ncbi:hypothetical protein QIS74_09512 [Colletotrichum tabaci]|uniref:Uncharacterized protein n=1 Tax=Colletotrichum tabaci TaxID=1209068 RepID=A0AAV9T4J8_9PEZI
MLQVHIQAREANLWGQLTVIDDALVRWSSAIQQRIVEWTISALVGTQPESRLFLTPIIHGAATDEDSAVSLTSLCKRVPVCGAGNLGTQPALSGHCP